MSHSFDTARYRASCPELPIDNNHWIVIGIGSFKKSERSQSFKVMRVAFAKIKDKRDVYDDGVMHEHTQEFKYTWQLASYIAMFQPGSIWTKKAGVCHCIHYPKKHNLSASFSGNLLRKSVPIHQLIKKDEFMLGQAAFSHYLQVPSSNYVLLIPCSEILRVEYGFSVDLVQAVLGNWLSLQPYRLYQPDKSMSEHQSSTGVAHLHLAKSVSHGMNFIKTLANLVFDNDAKSCVERAYSSLISNSNKAFGTTSLSITPLSLGNISFKFIGTVLFSKIDDRQCVIVHNIVQWSAPLPINQLTYAADLDNRQGLNKDDVLPIKTFPSKRQFDDEIDIPAHTVKRDSMADSNKEKHTIIIPLPFLDGMQNIELRKTEKDIQTCKGKPGCGGLHSQGDVAGGETSSDNGLAAPMRIDDGSEDNLVDDEPNFRASAGLLKFANAIVKLQRDLGAHKGASNSQVISFKKPSSLVLDNPQLIDSPIFVNALPNKVDGELTLFSYIDVAKQLRRAYMIFIVSVNDCECLIIETQRKSSSESIATYILMKQDKSSFSNADIDLLLASVAVNGPTILPRSVLQMFNRQQINHLKNDGATDVAKRLKDRILSAVLHGKGKLAGEDNETNTSKEDAQSTKASRVEGIAL